jgi:hypothetical protein
LASAVAIGTTNITATLGLVSASTDLSVTDATLTSVVVTPANLDLPRGVSQQYVAQATFSDGSVQDITQQAVWTSSDDSIASVSNDEGSEGLVKTLDVGSTTISATLVGFGGSPGTTGLTVNNLLVSALEIRPEAVTCGRTRSFQFSAVVVYNDDSEQDLTAQARWTSSLTRIASIGLTTGLAKNTGNPNRTGDTVITAKLLGMTDTSVLTKVQNKNTVCTATP